MKRPAMVLMLAFIVVGLISAVPTDPVVAAPMLDARLLIISADGTEPVLGAIQQALDYLGTPYDVWIAASRPNQLTGATLGAGQHSFYQGVILTTGELGYSPRTACFG